MTIETYDFLTLYSSKTTLMIITGCSIEFLVCNPASPLTSNGFTNKNEIIIRVYKPAAVSLFFIQVKKFQQQLLNNLKDEFLAIVYPVCSAITICITSTK